jgi:hypothetical protein
LKYINIELTQPLGFLSQPQQVQPPQERVHLPPGLFLPEEPLPPKVLESLLAQQFLSVEQGRLEFLLYPQV